MNDKYNVDKKKIINALLAADGQTALAAHLLGIPRGYLYRKCRQYKLRAKDYSASSGAA